jgi:hypothetical protein
MTRDRLIPTPAELMPEPDVRFEYGKPTYAVVGGVTFTDPSIIDDLRAGEARMRERIGAVLDARHEATDEWALAIIDAHGVTIEDAPRRCRILTNRTEHEPGAWADTLTMEIDGKIVGEPLVFEMKIEGWGGDKPRISIAREIGKP